MIYVKDLKDQTNMKGNRPILHCTVCGADYSANAGDYFNCEEDTPLFCCNEPLRLGFKKVVFEDISDYI